VLQGVVVCCGGVFSPHKHSECCTWSTGVPTRVLQCVAVAYSHHTNTVNAALGRHGYLPECYSVLQWRILTTQTQLMLPLLDRDANRRRVAVCCSMLQCVVLCCSHVSMGCSVLQYVAVCCAVLQSRILTTRTQLMLRSLDKDANTLQHTATHCTTAIHCNTHSPHTYT